jgi:zinc transporter ZupT
MPNLFFAAPLVLLLLVPLLATGARADHNETHVEEGASCADLAPLNALLGTNSSVNASDASLQRLYTAMLDAFPSNATDEHDDADDEQHAAAAGHDDDAHEDALHCASKAELFKAPVTRAPFFAPHFFPSFNGHGQVNASQIVPSMANSLMSGCSRTAVALIHLCDVDDDESVNATEFASCVANFALHKFGAPTAEAPAHQHKKRGIRAVLHASRKRAVASAVPPCKLPGELMLDFDVNGNGRLCAAEFSFAVPSLLLISSGQCALAPTGEACVGAETSAGSAWAAGLGVSVLLSFVSLCGVVLIPFQKRSFRERVMTPMISFAVGALVGDALLHLIPEAIGVHSHDAEGEEDELAYVWYMMVTLLGVVAFFVLERHIEHMHGPDEKHAHHHLEKAAVVDEDPAAADESRRTSDSVPEMTSDADTVALADEHAGKMHHIATVGWLNLISDAVHNFVDGIALGAAFSFSLQVGLATSIAIFCHELPQELADFAILIHAGFSKKQALGLNLLCSLTSVLGVMIGLGIGTTAVKNSRWLLAFTAGNFLYIALADMIQALHQIRGWRQTVLQASVMAVGVLIMLALTFVEEALEPEAEHCS